MDRKRLSRHKSNKRELALIEKQLDRLYERLENVETVSGKVTKSGDDFPYIEEYVTVQMAEPKAATAIKTRSGRRKTDKGCFRVRSSRWRALSRPCQMGLKGE